MTPTPLQATLYDSIAAVPREIWSDVLGAQSCTYSHAFWSLVEASKLNDFAYRYAIFHDATGVPVGLAAFYSLTTDIAIFAPSPFREILAFLRRGLPWLFKLRMLECGTPITINSPPFVVRAGHDARAVADAVITLLEAITRREGQMVIVVRDFEPWVDELREAFAQRAYSTGQILPNTYLDIIWPTRAAYLASLKSYYRSKLVKHWKHNQALGVTHELVDDFAPLADVLSAQWMKVHQRASEFSREVLNADFYRNFSNGMGARSKVILFKRDGRLVGHALLLLDGSLLRWLYFGREEAVNDSLYLYVGQAVIETAIILGVKRLEMGLTTYMVKQDMGATLVPVHLALRSTFPGMNPLIRFFYPLLNRPPPITQRSVFKQG